METETETTLMFFPEKREDGSEASRIEDERDVRHDKQTFFFSKTQKSPQHRKLHFHAENTKHCYVFHF